MFTFNLDSLQYNENCNLQFQKKKKIGKISGNLTKFLCVFKHFFNGKLKLINFSLQAIIMVLPSPPRIQCRRVLKVPQAPIATCMVVSATWISLVLIPVRRGNVDEIAQMWKPWRPSTHKMTLNHRAKTKTQKRNPVKTLTKVEKHFNYCILLQTFYLRRYFFVPLLILNAQLLQVGFNFVYIKYLQWRKKHSNW